MKPMIGIRRLITLAAVIATTAGGGLGLAATASASADASYATPTLVSLTIRPSAAQSSGRRIS